MARRLVILLCLALAALAANVKLYLKDGGYHVVREYQVLADRVRFYSVERSQWEEMPLDLVDLKRTEGEAAARKASLAEEAKLISAEENAERAQREEISRIPQDPGVYWVEGGKVKALPVAETHVRTNKGRSILQRLSPLPLVTGKGTLELNRETSLNVFTGQEQEFYLQLSELEQFGIAKLTPKGGVRIIENLVYMPKEIGGDVIEEPVMVPALQRELAERLYKIWPKEPLPPGEYAVIQYTPGKLNMQVWDFAVKPSR